MAGKLVLHIGSTKTGTSAIQSALVRNREALRARGVLVPPGRRDNKAEEGRVTGGNGWMLHAFKSRFQKNPNIALQRLHARLQEICVDAGDNTVIISSEALGGYDSKQLASLKPVLDQYFDEVQVVYLVRHLTDHALSRYSEYVKRRSRKKSFARFVPSYKAPFKLALKNYEAVFGRDAITCLLYEDVRDHIFATFLETIGVPSDELESPEFVNRSLTADEIEVFRVINAKGFDQVHVAKVIEDFAYTTQKIGRRYPAIPKASIKAIERKHRDVLDFVNERLRSPSQLQAASSEIIAIADTLDEAAEPELDPGILLGVLESSLRVSEARIKELKDKQKKQEAAKRKKLEAAKLKKQQAAQRNAITPKTLPAKLKRRAKRILGGS